MSNNGNQSISASKLNQSIQSLESEITTALDKLDTLKGKIIAVSKERNAIKALEGTYLDDKIADKIMFGQVHSYKYKVNIKDHNYSFNDDVEGFNRRYDNIAEEKYKIINDLDKAKEAAAKMEQKKNQIEDETARSFRENGSSGSGGGGGGSAGGSGSSGGSYHPYVGTKPSSTKGNYQQTTQARKIESPALGAATTALSKTATDYFNKEKDNSKNNNTSNNNSYSKNSNSSSTKNNSKKASKSVSNNKSQDSSVKSSGNKNGNLTSRGISYSGGASNNYSSEKDYKDNLLENITNSVEDITKGRSKKIPLSSFTVTNKEGVSKASAIPIAAGLTAAGASGLGYSAIHGIRNHEEDDDDNDKIEEDSLLLTQQLDQATEHKKTITKKDIDELLS